MDPQPVECGSVTRGRPEKVKALRVTDPRQWCVEVQGLKARNSSGGNLNPAYSRWLFRNEIGGRYCPEGWRRHHAPVSLRSAKSVKR